MSYDGLVMEAIKTELEQTLIGGRIEKIYQPTANEAVLIIHRERSKYRLLVSAHARDARIHITTGTKNNPLTPPMFCMVLRKHIEGGRITSIEQQGLERCLVIKAEAVDELGMLSEKQLICEVMGKHSNIVLVDSASGVILDGIHRYSYGTSRHREILPGRRYIPPPETGKADPLTITEEGFRTLVWNPEADSTVESILLQSFEGLSPQSCREIAFRSGLYGVYSHTIGEIELEKLWKSISDLRNNVNSNKFTPVLYYLNNLPKTFSAIDLTCFTGDRCTPGSINQVLDDFFIIREKREQLQQSTAQLNKIVKAEKTRCEKKIKIHRETLHQATEAENLKILGELITANIFQIPEGAENVELINYHDPLGSIIKIELNPHLSPAKNAQAYFKRYAKARNSRAITEEYLAKTLSEQEYLESVLLALEQAEQTSDLTEIKSELVKEDYIKPEQTSKKAKKSTPDNEPVVLSFKTADSYEILVGRNNRQNDYLTMKLARPDDLWLHVKEIHGSHVIIKNPLNLEIPDTVLEQAAALAAYYSKARESSKVPVDYTLKKHVRKPKGAKPGMVIYDNQKTIIIEPKLPII
jgi:predicted ribosome quality control (RQC) complex YloA/Tae2 family protein